MPERLVFPDPRAATDLLTFAARVEQLPDTGVRLQAAGGVMRVSAAVLVARGLLDATPTVLGMRVIGADPELECDLVVDAAALTARGVGEVVLPEHGLAPAWAGVAPPREGWLRRGAVAAAVLAARAQWGIAAVAEAVPAASGEDAVRAVRAAVWGVADDDLEGMPRGAAFAAYALGFIAGEESAAVFTAAAWTRLTLARGHVLVRGPARTGLTAVRDTGSFSR